MRGQYGQQNLLDLYRHASKFTKKKESYASSKFSIHKLSQRKTFAKMQTAQEKGNKKVFIAMRMISLFIRPTCDARRKEMENGHLTARLV